MRNDSSSLKQQIIRLKAIAKRIFPNFFTELAVIVAIISTLIFSGNLMSTATSTQEETLVRSDNESSVMQEVIKQTEFEVSNKQTSHMHIEYPTSQMCFIGDVRVMDMDNAVVTDAHFITKDSMDIDWFNNTAVAMFEEKSEDIDLCVVAFGMNDVDDVDSCITGLNEFAEKYPEKVFVFVNVGPVDETKYISIQNKSLKEFNMAIQQGLSNKWQVVDLYTYLINEGFTADNGIRYSHKDYAKIFTWIVSSVKTQTIEILQ